MERKNKYILIALVVGLLLFLINKAFAAVGGIKINNRYKANAYSEILDYSSLKKVLTAGSNAWFYVSAFEVRNGKNYAVIHYINYENEVEHAAKFLIDLNSLQP